jgi:hypothetical protein
VAAPIEIGALQEAEAVDLVRALASRGLIGRRAEHGDELWLEVWEAREDTERLLGEVSAAVADWLADHDRPTLELRVGARVQTVAARGDLPDALRARAAAATRSGRKTL